MSNLIASNDGQDTFVISLISRWTIGYYYPEENPESWSPEEYKEKRDTLVAQLRRDIEYKAKARFFGEQVQKVIAQDFTSEQIILSSIFRSRPVNSEEWSKIGVSITIVNQNGEKEYVNIPLPDNINDIRTYILSHITMLIGKEENSNVIPLEPTKNVA